MNRVTHLPLDETYIIRDLYVNADLVECVQIEPKDPNKTRVHIGNQFWIVKMPIDKVIELLTL